MRSMCFFTHLLHTATLHYDPPWGLGCIHKPYSDGACGCHGNCNTQRLQRSLCFIKWPQGMTKHMWASGTKDVRSDFDLFGLLLMFLKNENKLLINWDLCFLSQEYVLFMYMARLSLPVNAAALDKFMKKQMAARGLLPAVCFIFSWKLDSFIPVIRKPVNNSFVFLVG